MSYAFAAPDIMAVMKAMKLNQIMCCAAELEIENIAVKCMAESLKASGGLHYGMVTAWRRRDIA